MVLHDLLILAGVALFALSVVLVIVSLMQNRAPVNGARTLVAALAALVGAAFVNPAPFSPSDIPSALGRVFTQSGLDRLTEVPAPEGAAKDAVVDGADAAKEAVVDGAVAVKDAVVDGAVATKDVVVDGAVVVKDAVVDGASAATEAVTDAAKSAGAAIEQAVTPDPAPAEPSPAASIPAAPVPMTLAPPPAVMAPPTAGPVLPAPPIGN